MYQTAFIVILLVAISQQQGGNSIDKCWFGDPLETMCKNDSDCGDTHVCVNRTNSGAIPSKWNGCCPRGKGVCTEKLQKTPTDPKWMDLVPPTCADNGEFAPEQCSSAGCICTLPNGKPIEGTFTSHGPARLQRNCTDVVQKELQKQPVTPVPVTTETPVVTQPATLPPDETPAPPPVNTETPAPPAPPPMPTKAPITQVGPCRTLRRRLGVIGPRCNRYGMFKPRQCNADAGCWCSFPNGTMVKGTLLPPGSRREGKKCRMIVDEAVNKIKTTPKTETLVQKCWFDEPLEQLCNNDSQCPPSHLCVHRSDPRAIPTSWNGCCSRGNGVCTEMWQRRDPTVNMPTPLCDDNGMFEPEQCQENGCHCTLPDGTVIQDTYAEHGPPRDQRNCNDLVQEALKDNTDPGVTESKPSTSTSKTAPSEETKCRFGESTKDGPCQYDSDCPDASICVSRTYNGNQWSGCCKRMKRPCKTMQQRIGFDPIYEPKCDRKGFFKPKQCNSTACWCSFPGGKPIESTLFHPNPPLKAKTCRNILNSLYDV